MSQLLQQEVFARTQLEGYVCTMIDQLPTVVLLHANYKSEPSFIDSTAPEDGFSLSKCGF